MNVTELQATLIRYAEADMAGARKGSGCIITNTKVGHVDVTYNRDERTYRIATMAECVNGKIVDGTVLYKGKAAGAKLTIANLYQVMS